MKWGIVTDSSCDFEPNSGNDGSIPLFRAPFFIHIGGACHRDDETLSTDAILDEMQDAHAACSTSCPSPADYAELFKQSENTLAVTISSNLSGGYNSAMLARDITLREHPEKRIHVFDSKSAGPALLLCVEEAKRLIAEGLPFSEIVTRTEEYLAKRRTVFALQSFTNLVRNGRMSKTVGFVAGKLKIWGVGIASKMGTIEMAGKAKGVKRAIDKIVSVMASDGFHQGTVVISHCKNETAAEDLADAIRANWENAHVRILPAGGLCSFYAERGGIIVAY